MTIIQKNILASLQASAKSAMTEDKIKPISIGSLAATIGTSPDQIRQDIYYLCNQGFIDPGEVDVQTAADLRPGQVVVILQLDPQKTLPFNGEVEAKELKSEAEAPFLTVAQDTYHAVSTPEADGSFTLEIVENQGTKYETVVFRETSVMTFEAVDQLRREWADNRENTLSWEFRADKGKGEVLLAFEVNRIVEDGKETLEIRHCDPITGGYIADPQYFNNPEPEEGSEEPVESIWNIWSVFMRREVDLRFPDAKPDVTISAKPTWVDDDGDLLSEAQLYPNFAETGGRIDEVFVIEGEWYFLNRVGKSPEGTSVAWEFANIEMNIEPLPNSIEYGANDYSVTGYKYFALETWDAQIVLNNWLGDAYEPESPAIEDVEVADQTDTDSDKVIHWYSSSVALRNAFGNFENHIPVNLYGKDGQVVTIEEHGRFFITGSESDGDALMVVQGYSVLTDPRTQDAILSENLIYHAVNDRLAEAAPEEPVQEPKSKGKKAKETEEEPAKKEDFDPYDEER